MYDINQIKETEKIITDATSQVKTMQEKSLPNLIDKIIHNLPDNKKALFQEFAQESSKIFSTTLKKKQTSIEEEIQQLMAKYEQRINNT